MEASLLILTLEEVTVALVTVPAAAVPAALSSAALSSAALSSAAASAFPSSAALVSVVVVVVVPLGEEVSGTAPTSIVDVNKNTAASAHPSTVLNLVVHFIILVYVPF